jgi:hypothetical protein
MILIPILTQYLLYFFAKRRQEKLASACCNIGDTATSRCGENEDEDESIVTDAIEDDITYHHRNLIKHSILLKEDDVRDDSLA